MIRVENLNKYFNRFRKNQIHVINNTSFELEKNGLVALLGPSGSGKTTLLNALGGLDKVSSGKIYVNGKRITKRLQGSIDKIRNLNIGYIFQDYKLVDNLSVYDNVALVLKMIGIKDKNEIDKRVCYVLEKVGMLRYKRRPANMLSGGERQRVGIARAIVKNPNIIIADEPTGNLDSKNSVEIMNIIKAISKDKLVILVTHEVNLAKFYATQIIELEDGKIIHNYPNDNESYLDYEIGNTLYLKDYDIKNNFNGITVYTNLSDMPKLDIVYEKNNIYIRCLGNEKMEIIDDNSMIEMKDEHFKNITKEEIMQYDFDFDKITSHHKMRYSSIFNPFTFIINGFTKVFSYSLLKKILLIGFFLSGIFIMYSISSIYRTLNIKDENFVKINKNYALIDNKKIKLEDYSNYENNLGGKYILPSNSIRNFSLVNNMFYQTNIVQCNMPLSVVSQDVLTKNDIILGRMPQNDNEVLIDIFAVEKQLKSNDVLKMIGIKKVEDFLNKEFLMDEMSNFKIVGIVSFNSPSIYIHHSKLIDTLYYLNQGEEDGSIIYDSINEVDSYHNYLLFEDRIVLKEGRLPKNDYEVLINDDYKYLYSINKEYNKAINGKKLIVVGYYTSKENFDYDFVNDNMIKIRLINKSEDISVYSDNVSELVLNASRKYNINIKDSYQYSKNQYIKKNNSLIKSSLINSLIILSISLIEVFLMIRSSFLSRIKEVGIYRAIGVKKLDIYIMFSGEIIAITTLASVSGILLCAYIISCLLKTSFFADMFILNGGIIMVSIILSYIFNLFIGLIPIFNTIRKRPAEILARNDI